MCKATSIIVISFYCFLNAFGSKTSTCPAGFYCLQNTGRSGSFNKHITPIPCAIGTYSNYGDGFCKPCEPGYYTMQKGSASCDPCPTGSMCKVPDRNPELCPIGTYSSCIAQERCTPCPLRTYNVQAGSTHCIKCPAGARCDHNASSSFVNIPANAKWAQNGVTIAGGHGRGNATNQLNQPHGLFVDDDQTVVIADTYNHR
ncbi:unnamed protein product, partial [Rotaria magnacalcarata]